MSSGTGPSKDGLGGGRFPLWVGLALSVATVGPTLAMAGNGQELVGTVGRSIPLVFVIGLIGVSLVGYSFVRLTRHLNHAGSVYALVGATVGPRAGFFAGFAMLGAYGAFCVGTLALTAAFANSLLAAFTPSEVRHQLVAAHLAGLTVRLISDRHLAVYGSISQ